MSGGLPTTGLTLDPATGLLRDPDGRLVRTPFVLTDGSAEVAGRVIASDPRRGVFLYELDGPLRQTAIVEGLHPNDTWSGPAVTYRRLSCEGGKLTVGLQSDPNLYRTPSTVTAAGRSTRVAPDGRQHDFTSRSDRSTASVRSRSRSRRRRAGPRRPAPARTPLQHLPLHALTMARPEPRSGSAAAAKLRAAASSVAPVRSTYGRSLRPCIACFSLAAEPVAATAEP